jgi:hypothetical protein
MRTRRAWDVLMLILVLAGCEAMQPIPPYALHPAVGAQEAQRSAALRRESSPPAAPVPVQWSFSIAAGECVATASGPSRAATLTARVGRTVSLAASPGDGASRLAFSGPGGSWTLRTAGTSREAAVTMPLDGAAVGRLLALLAGGRLKLEGGGPRSATLLLPDAGVSGRDWMGCVNDKTREAAGHSIASQ